MRVLIVGAGGQVGRALLASAPAGVSLVAMSRRDLDVTRAGDVQQAVGRVAPDIVINAAAYTAVDRAQVEADAAEAVNHAAVASLAEACAAHAARLIHFSTDFVFSGASPRPYRPEDPPAPLNVYGRSKWRGEVAALSRPDSLVIRTAWVYAARGSNFVTSMLRLMAGGEEVRVVADQLGTPTHAASLARATWAMTAGGARGLRHFTDAGVASRYDFAVAIGEEAQSLGLLNGPGTVTPIATADYPTPATRPPCSILDASATWAATGGPPRHWRAELRHMLRTLRDDASG